MSSSSREGTLRAHAYQSSDPGLGFLSQSLQEVQKKADIQTLPTLKHSEAVSSERKALVDYWFFPKSSKVYYRLRAERT